MDTSFLSSLYFWMGMCFLFLILWLICFIFLIVLGKKTHAIIEFKGWMGGKPIAMFFQDNGYVEWKASKVEAGIIEDKNFGSFIINETGSYVDRKTKNIIIPFDASFASSVNMRAAKVADELQYIIRDRQQLGLLRTAVAMNQIDEETDIILDSLKTSIQVSAIKSMVTAMIPHNITAKIEKAIAAKMKNFGKIDAMQLLLIFGGVLGAIIMGYILIKNVGGK